LSIRSGYDIVVWEEIGSTVSRKIDRLVEDVKNEIPKDRSLVEFQRQQPVPWQLREMMVQRANGWVQRVYDLCCEDYKRTGKTLSPDFERAVWAYCIEPFINGQKEDDIHRQTMSGFLELLLYAVGSPWEKRRFLTIEQKNCCLNVRGKICEAWYQQLHRSRVVEAPEAAYRQASAVVDVLSNAPKATTWEEIQILFLSDERVQILNGPSRETRNYAEFGFADGRTEKPNVAWETLRAMAQQRGVLQDETVTKQPWPKVEKRIQEIRKVLRDHFGISVDPIPFVEGVGYRAQFKIGCGPSFET
jgi:hypothetical protein